MRKSLTLTAAGAALAFGLALPGTAAAQGTGPDVRPADVSAQDVDCTTGVSESDNLEGYAFCKNNTAGPVNFRVNLVCGLAPDVSSDWVRLEPGQGAQAVAGCAGISSGVGGVAAEHRPA